MTERAGEEAIAISFREAIEVSGVGLVRAMRGKRAVRRRVRSFILD